MQEDKNQESRPVAPTEQNNIKPTKNLKAADQERIAKWKERAEKEGTSFSWKHVKDENDKEVHIAGQYPEELTETQKYELNHSTVCAASGSSSSYGSLLFSQIPSACFIPDDINKRLKLVNDINATMVARAPADDYEGEIIGRLVVLHNHYMNFMARAAAPNQTHASIDLNINRATKLMRIYNETLDALNKHRRKGEQRVTVQHVNVNNGGQAVVGGNISTGGGDNAKK